jgi:hypothetical protein
VESGVSSAFNDLVQYTEEGAEYVEAWGAAEASQLASSVDGFVVAAAAATEEQVGAAVAIVDKFAESVPALSDQLWSDAQHDYTVVLAGAEHVWTSNLVPTLDWMGNEFKQAWADVCEYGLEAMADTCTAALTVIVCVASRGAYPGCEEGALDVLTGSMEDSAAKAGPQAAVACDIYEALSSFGVCGGTAYSIGLNLAFVVTGDQFGAACDDLFSCLCGDCPFSCDTVVPSLCTGMAVSGSPYQVIKEVQMSAIGAVAATTPGGISCFCTSNVGGWWGNYSTCYPADMQSSSLANTVFNDLYCANNSGSLVYYGHSPPTGCGPCTCNQVGDQFSDCTYGATNTLAAGQANVFCQNTGQAIVYAGQLSCTASSAAPASPALWFDPGNPGMTVCVCVGTYVDGQPPFSTNCCLAGPANASCTSAIPNSFVAGSCKQG